MIYTDILSAQLLGGAIILISAGLIVWGALHLRKPYVKRSRPSIYARHPGLWQNLKAQWMFGWNAGRAAAEKRKQEKKK